MQYCLGDWCGGPIEPVDGSWHVTWVVDGEARPEMPDSFLGRYRDEGVEVVQFSRGHAHHPARAMTSLAARASTRAWRQAAQAPTPLAARASTRA